MTLSNMILLTRFKQKKKKIFFNQAGLLSQSSISFVEYVNFALVMHTLM